MENLHPQIRKKIAPRQSYTLSPQRSTIDFKVAKARDAYITSWFTKKKKKLKGFHTKKKTL